MWDIKAKESSESSESSSSESTEPETCEWVLAIPFVVKRDEIYVLSVLDKEFKEWTFISGKVDAGESCGTAVMRELREETKNCVEMKLTAWNHKVFNTEYVIRKIPRKFKVYMIDITNSDYTMLLEYKNNITGCFKKSKMRGKKYNENLDINFGKLSDFMKNKKLWDFMYKIFENKDFKKYVKELSNFVG